MYYITIGSSCLKLLGTLQKAIAAGRAFCGVSDPVTIRDEAGRVVARLWEV